MNVRLCRLLKELIKRRWRSWRVLGKGKGGAMVREKESRLAVLIV